MSKKFVLIIIAVFFVAGSGYLIYSSILKNNPGIQPTVSPQNEELKITIDPLNATYVIEGEQFLLINGKSEILTLSDTATKTTTLVFGIPTKGDLNSDDIEDAAFILTQNSGGSGTFFYIVADIYSKTKAKDIGTNGILLGDRIAPQNVLIQNGTIVVNYADRNPGEPMSVQPSLGVTRYFGVLESGENETLFEK